MLNWIDSHLPILGIVSISAIALSFVRLRFTKPQWIVLLVGVLLLGVVLFEFVRVILAPPGPGDLDDEKVPPKPRPTPTTSHLERLRLTWNSEANADWPVAESLATISEIAYLSPVDAKESYGKLGFTEFMPIVASSMIGYVITGEDVTVVAFRGTDFNELPDWIANLKTYSTDTPHGPIHDGFFHSYLSLKPQITKLLATRGHKHLWITGHSLGGALALVCSYDLIESEKLQVDGVITFGQPMIAREQLARHLDTNLLGRYARFVNEADMVPRIPPGHTACGSLVWFTGGGIKRSKPMRAKIAMAAPRDLSDKSEDEIRPLSEKEFEQLQTQLKAAGAGEERLPNERMAIKAAALPFVDDHSMDLYLDKIRRHLGTGNEN